MGGIAFSPVFPLPEIRFRLQFFLPSFLLQSLLFFCFYFFCFRQDEKDFHLDRAPHCDCDHRDFSCNAFAGFEPGETESSNNILHKQFKTDRNHNEELDQGKTSIVCLGKCSFLPEFPPHFPFIPFDISSCCCSRQDNRIHFFPLPFCHFILWILFKCHLIAAH